MHTHETDYTFLGFDWCACGAMRRTRRPGEHQDPWHICDLCRPVGGVA